MKKTLILLLISLVIQTIIVDAKPGKAAIATGLSIIIPGGGQIYNKQFGKAILIAGAEVTTAYFIQEFNKRSIKAENEQEKIKYENYRNNMIWLLGGEIVYSSIDAFIDSQMADMNKKIDISIKKGGVYLCYKF